MAVLRRHLARTSQATTADAQIDVPGPFCAHPPLRRLFQQDIERRGLWRRPFRHKRNVRSGSRTTHGPPSVYDVYEHASLRELNGF